MENERAARPGQETMVHLILQGKGGVGKSMIAAILGQYFRAQGLPGMAICGSPCAW